MIRRRKETDGPPDIWQRIFFALVLGVTTYLALGMFDK